jgi:hypothetical protein
MMSTCVCGLTEGLPAATVEGMRLSGLQKNHKSMSGGQCQRCGLIYKPKGPVVVDILAGVKGEGQVSRGSFP